MKPIAYIGGTFDLTHYGHYKLFERVASMGFEVYVAVNSDKFTSSFKRKPILSEKERLANIQACKWVTHAFIVDFDTQRTAIMDIQPNVIVHGDDWVGDSLLKNLDIDKEFIELHNIGILYLPYTKGISTTELIKRCNTQQ